MTLRITKTHLFGILALCLSLQSCIGDYIENDRVPRTIRILNPIDSLGVDSVFQIETLYLNKVGLEDMAIIDWSSSNPSVASVSPTGQITGLSEGASTIKASVVLADPNASEMAIISAQFSLGVAEKASSVPISTPSGKDVTISASSSAYVLRGTGRLQENTSGGFVLEFDSDYVADRRLPGLYVYLTNNPSTNAGALEIAKVTTFNGSHRYNLPSTITNLNQFSHVLYYCKPFSVKVGDGELR